MTEYSKNKLVIIFSMSKLKDIRLKVGGICMGKLIKYISILLIVVLVLSACGKAVIKMKE